jgi:hypothetical protein
MIQFKTVAASLFVGAALVAYGCSSNDPAASAPVDLDSGTAETGVADTGADAGACRSTQLPAEIDKCFAHASIVSPAAKPVTVACLPAALAAERPKGFAFEDVQPGTWLLTEAYDLTADCAKASTVVETLSYGSIYVNVATEYTARADGANGKTGTQYVRLPPPPPPETGDAGDAGDASAADAAPPPPPPPQEVTFGPRNCPPSWPQVACKEIKTWFDGGFYTATPTELRLFKNAPGTTDGGAANPATAQLYAVYKKTK